MNWIEKVRFLIEKEKSGDYDKDKYFIDITPEISKWAEGELENAVKKYPFVPNEYLTFIKEFDSIGLSFIAFYGSKAFKDLVLIDEIAELSEYTNIFHKDYFAFGKDVDGSVFAFNPAQEVVRFDIEDYEFEEEPEHISNNFVEFIDQYVLGSKCEYNLNPNDSFCGYLYKLGWIKS